ncbi:MAG: hypothetical protein WDZ61_00195 [Parcubacteria group bacterium]
MDNKENIDSLSVLATSIIILLITVAVILLWDEAQHMNLDPIEEPSKAVSEDSPS